MEVESGTWITFSEQREHKELSSFRATIYKLWRRLIEPCICFDRESMGYVGFDELVKRRVLLYLNLQIKIEVLIFNFFLQSLFLLLILLVLLSWCFRVFFLLPLLHHCLEFSFSICFGLSIVVIAVVAFQDTKVYTIIIEHCIVLCCLGLVLIEEKDLAIFALEKVLLIGLLWSQEIKAYDWLCDKAVVTVKRASWLCIIPVRNNAEGLSRFFWCLSSWPLVDGAFLFIFNLLLVWLFWVIKFSFSIVCTIVFHDFWLN